MMRSRYALAVVSLLLLSGAMGAQLGERPATRLSSFDHDHIEAKYRDAYLNADSGNDPALRKLLPYEAITLKHNAVWFGESFQLTFRRDGTAERVKPHNRQGEAYSVGTLGVRDFAKLCYFIEKSGFEKLDGREFLSLWTCDSTSTITVVRDGRTIKVVDYAEQAPIEVWAIEQVIEGLGQRTQWTSTQPSTWPTADQPKP